MGSKWEVIILADSPGAACRLCGISMLERLLRNLQRLGLTKVTVFSGMEEREEEELRRFSWARSLLAVRMVPSPHAADLSIDGVYQAMEEERAVVLEASTYCDPRLLAHLGARTETAALVDSAPPAAWQPLLKIAAHLDGEYLCGPVLATRRWLAGKEGRAGFLETVRADLALNHIGKDDVAAVPGYIPAMRRDLRPLWFPVPSLQHQPLAETLLLDAAQNGTLDAPALVHAPVETAIVSRLCRTSITPNQVTLFTSGLGLVVTAFFATGNLWAGAAAALVIGILDGVDGKLARVKVETTELGGWEHELDYVIETSWWAALAFSFAKSAVLPQAWMFFSLLFLSDLIDRLAKKIAKKRLARNLDDASRFDRFIRFIGGRRNIYVWIFTLGLALGEASGAYVFLCCWGAATAAVHVVRALRIVAQAATG